MIPKKDYRFYKDNKDNIWLVPKRLIDSGAIDQIKNIEDFGYRVNLQHMVEIMNDALDKNNLN